MPPPSSFWRFIIVGSGSTLRFRFVSLSVYVLFSIGPWRFVYSSILHALPLSHHYGGRREGGGGGKEVYLTSCDILRVCLLEEVGGKEASQYVIQGEVSQRSFIVL